MHSLEIDECGADALSSLFPKKYAAAVPFAAALYLVKNRDMNETALNEALERTVLMFSRRLNARLDVLRCLQTLHLCADCSELLRGLWRRSTKFKNLAEQLT